ncbi:MAG: 30S ribosomal protein S16 [Gemmataceae bacterium]|nr:30S ribosomal protein S16 [Gemmataceae bacterium]
MKQMGRKHRHYYRIVAIDHEQARDGRVIEELGTYDPHMKDNTRNVTLLPDRIDYWVSVGAKPSEHVAAIMKRFMDKERARLAEQAATAQAPAEAPTA